TNKLTNKQDRNYSTGSVRLANVKRREESHALDCRTTSLKPQIIRVQCNS
ncbi:hypothetical protein M9458_050315, partial [Cirrhinus mrigala]